MDDRQLVLTIQSGDENAFALLLTRHTGRLLATIRPIVKDDDLADDLLQEVCIRILEKLRNRSYQETDRFLPWALRIARNLAIDSYRKKQRNPEIQAPANTQMLEQTHRTWENPEMNWCQSEDRQYVLRWIEELPAAQREVLLLRHYEQLSFREIAEQTNVSINTALGRMRYALINLRKIADRSAYVA